MLNRAALSPPGACPLYKSRAAVLGSVSWRARRSTSPGGRASGRGDTEAESACPGAAHVARRQQGSGGFWLAARAGGAPGWGSVDQTLGRGFRPDISGGCPYGGALFVVQAAGNGVPLPTQGEPATGAEAASLPRVA